MTSGMGSSSFICWAKEIKPMGKRRSDQVCLENASLFEPWGYRGKNTLIVGSVNHGPSVPKSGTSNF